jgi:Zn-dependent protease
VGVHWSVAVIFALVAWELADITFPDRYGGGVHPIYWVAAVVAATLFFVSLLAHEASHAVVARRRGVGVRSITLWLFGGVAQLDGEAPSAGADFAIAAVGPATSMVLAAVFGATQIVLQKAGVHGLPVDVTAWLWQINALLAVFNLIPAAPLDGGRILRAGLWRGVVHDRVRASVLAARAGVAFGIALVALGAVEFFLGSPIGLWPAFLGWFLLVAARAEERAARQHGAVESLSVAEVMVPHPPVLPSTLTVGEILQGTTPWWPGAEAAALVGAFGWLEGVVTTEQVRNVAPGAQARTRLGDIAHPITSVAVGRPEEPMTALLSRMYASGGNPAVVLDPSNRLAGVVTLQDVERAGGAHRVSSERH